MQIERLSVDELRNLHDRMCGPHPTYAYQEASGRMKSMAPNSDTLESMVVSLSVRIEIIEALLSANGIK